MKQTFEGWTVGAKINEYTYFMGIRKTYSGNKYITLEAYPTHLKVLKNLHKTKEDAIDCWKTGIWDFYGIDRESISVLPVKIKVDIDVGCLGLNWNGI